MTQSLKIVRMWPLLPYSYLFLIFPAVPTSQPVLVTDKDRYQPGEMLRVNCTSPPSRPATNLTVFVNEETVSLINVSSFISHWLINLVLASLKVGFCELV